MAKSRKLKSKAVTIAPGKRYYGPPELRPSTKYKRGGSVAQYLEKGGTLNERKKRDRRDPIKSKEIKLGHKRFIDIERAKFQIAKEAKAKQKAEAPTETETEVSTQVQSQGPGVTPEQPETEEIKKKSIAEQLWGPNIREVELRQAQAREAYRTLSLGGKIKYQAETVGMAAAAGGQLDYLIRLGTTSAKIHLAAQAAEKATIKASRQYITDVFKGAKAEQFGSMDIALNAASKILANPKTATLFRNIMIGAGVSVVTAAYVFKEIYGSRAFAGFIGKEEASQALNFGYKAAMDADDPIGAQNALDKKREILNAVETVQDKTPYINVIEGVNTFVESEVITLANQQTLLDKTLAGTDKWSKLREKEGDEFK